MGYCQKQSYHVRYNQPTKSDSELVPYCDSATGLSPFEAIMSGHVHVSHRWNDSFFFFWLLMLSLSLFRVSLFSLFSLCSPT